MPEMPTTPPSPDAAAAHVELPSSAVPSSQDVTRGPISRADNAPPQYPAQARRRAQSGTVVLKLHIAPTGQVSRVVITASSGVRLLDESATTAALNWRFQPALAQGNPVASVVQLPIEFMLVR